MKQKGKYRHQPNDAQTKRRNGRENAQTENCWHGANAANDPRRKRREITDPTDKISEQPLPTPPTQPKKN